jgi:hypothetical protein
MANEGTDPQIKIGVSLNAQTSAGADQAIADVNRAKVATTEANTATALSSQQAAVAAQAVATAEESATQIAREYGVSAQVVTRALELMGPASVQAAAGSTELEAALEAAQVEIAAGNVGWQERLALMRATAAAEMAPLEAEEAATAAGTNLAVVSEAVASRLTALGIAQTQVEATAIKMSVSLDIAARALIRIRNQEIADEVARTADAIQAMSAASDASAVSSEAAAVSADVSTVSTKAQTAALAQNAIMARRASDGVIDLAMGGRRAIQGVADLQYVLKSMIPEAAGLFMALGGIAIIGEIWERTQQKMARSSSEHASAQKQSADTFATAWKESASEVASALGQVEKAQEARATGTRPCASRSTYVIFQTVSGAVRENEG